MKKIFRQAFKPSILYASVPLLLMMVIPGCHKVKIPVILTDDFQQVNLVANTAGYDTARIDPLLLNAWGLAFSGGGTPWIASPGGHVSTVYDKDGRQARAAVAIPSPGALTGGSPAGVVFNASAFFLLSNGAKANFIFAGLDGVISAWNGPAGNTALRIIDNHETAVYTGLAIANIADINRNFLYAANFKAGRIDGFDQKFGMEGFSLKDAFKDPNLPAGYSPFNVQAIGDKLYVTYAKVGAGGKEEIGPGKGFVDIYTPRGALVKRFVSKGCLNAPWGVAQAPDGFFSDDMKGHDGQNPILIGNFGDGRINAFNSDGEFLGTLRCKGWPIEIEGLWALSFPPTTATTVDPKRLYFTAGPNGEKDGLFGYIIKKEMKWDY